MLNIPLTLANTPMAVVFIPSAISSQEKKKSHRKHFFQGFSSLLPAKCFSDSVNDSPRLLFFNDNYLSLKFHVSTKPRQHLQLTSFLL